MYKHMPDALACQKGSGLLAMFGTGADSWLCRQ